MIKSISSKDNKLLKLARQLKKKNVRANSGLFIVEGKKMIAEAVEYAKDDIKYLIASNSFLGKESQFIENIKNLCSTTDIYAVPANIFDEISDTDTPQGILAILEIPKLQLKIGDDCQRLVVLDGVSEPGNMGTIIRTAEALGFEGIYLMKGCTDIYAPKTVRSTMGSLFRMKFKTDCEISDIDELKNKGFSVIATTPAGDTMLEGYTPPKHCAVVIGNESHGVSNEMLNISDAKVKIKMDGLAESLNAAVAAGIVMHWIGIRK